MIDRTVLLMALLLSILTLALAPAAQAAQKSASATANVFKAITITATAQMSFGKLQYNGNGPATSYVVLSSKAPITRTSPDVQLLPNGGETPAIRKIVGEPGRVYRVTLSPVSIPGGISVSVFTLWSQNRGDISASRLGQFDAAGSDILRVGGTMVVPKGTKNNTFVFNPTILISYE